MKPRTHKLDSIVIVYDADCIDQPGAHLFDPDYWVKQGCLVGEAEGRGSASLLDTPFAPAVLRRYLRGGWPAKISHARYLFLGYERSRPLAEFRVLKELAAAGLPVPLPLAAMCRRKGLFYEGWLMTRRIMDVDPLADLLESRSGDSQLWRSIGASIRRFHDFGLIHADLNARNILVGKDNAINLIDFDRARITSEDSRFFLANLKRLRRSLDKLWPSSVRSQLEVCWKDLIDGYEQVAGSS